MYMFSNLFVLVDSSRCGNVDKNSCNENIFKDAYDISFSFSLDNVFFRNVEGVGQVYSDGRYTIKISGKGFLSSFPGDSVLRFFSSELFVLSSELGGRDCFATFDLLDDRLRVFDNAWTGFSRDSFHTRLIDASCKFAFPFIDVCLVSKVIKNGCWDLELREK